MLYVVRAFVFLLETALGCAGVDLTLTAAQSAPQGATLLGTTTVVEAGVAVLTISRGAGPAKRTFWTGYWTAAGRERGSVKEGPRREARPCAVT